MKKQIILSLVLGCSFILTGCDDYLGEAPRGNAVAETTDDYEALLNASSIAELYFMSSYYNYWKSDEIIFTENTLSSLTGNLQQPATLYNAFKYQDKTYQVDQDCPEMKEVYSQIYTYNLIVNNVGDSEVSAKDKEYLEAEARVARAYMHFLLAQWFGAPYNEATASNELAIPLVTKASTTESQFNRATVAEICDFVTSEMENYCPKLKDRKEHKMRIYKPTGYALMGKVYFMMGKYSEALKALQAAMQMLQSDNTITLEDYNETMAMYGYAEIPSYELSSFITIPSMSSETIWCRAYNPYYGMYFGWGAEVGFLTPKAYGLYGEGDLRRNMIVTTDGFGASLPYPSCAYLSAKTNLGVSLPEVYLMYAECEARVGSEQKARETLVSFRKTRMQSGYEAIPETVQSKNDLIRFCVDEESREMMGTGYRFYNIRRLWNDPLFQDMKPVTHTDGSNTYTLNEAQLKEDIPESILKWNENWR